MGKKFTRKEVDHLAFLARFSLKEKEKAKMARDLSEIIDFVSELRKLKSEDKEPFLFEDQINVFRKDEKPKRSDTESYLTNAPQRKRRFFKVPRILR
ncbi:Asp-tRNA(Asn)/Glu-tRNA(Gln) amidotransferase subunit GatC [bacterium]|nr:Asp-tRNA(Asn)/Glu-tRNA(Gln) amidotransferase subunit GatC [bacterium]